MEERKLGNKELIYHSVTGLFRCCGAVKKGNYSFLLCKPLYAMLGVN